MSNYGVLTLEEVAKIMKVSQKTVYRWVAAKKLRAAKIGHKTYRVLEKDLVKFIDSHMMK
ncbi:MAG: helix-turn-helix domain-containing protein [Patescibacteria group bacterium]|nr:helix-turn-helix domain-containing protein [Patescibacteria group bacterium]